MPEIAIENSTFERLQRHARPLLDTPDTVVNRALDALEKNSELVSKRDSPLQHRQIDPRKLPDLKHTKVLDATLNGEQIVRPNWNRLVEQVLRRAREQFPDFDDLRKVCLVNMVRGRKEDEGYRYFSEMDISIQGLSANNACAALVNSVPSLDVQLDFTFRWRSKEGADFPGEVAHLTLGSTA